MTISRRNEFQERVINLDGPDGNAFFLLGTAQNWLEQMGGSKEKIEQVMREMQAGDYTHLVLVFDRYFGNIVRLETNNDELLERLDAAMRTL